MLTCEKIEESRSKNCKSKVTFILQKKLKKTKVCLRRLILFAGAFCQPPLDCKCLLCAFSCRLLRHLLFWRWQQGSFLIEIIKRAISVLNQLRKSQISNSFMRKNIVQPTNVSKRRLHHKHAAYYSKTLQSGKTVFTGSIFFVRCGIGLILMGKRARDVQILHLFRCRIFCSLFSQFFKIKTDFFFATDTTKQLSIECT